MAAAIDVRSLWRGWQGYTRTRHWVCNDILSARAHCRSAPAANARALVPAHNGQLLLLSVEPVSACIVRTYPASANIMNATLPRCKGTPYDA
jgi:hypothetical protein